jgi:hypothetical protein
MWRIFVYNAAFVGGGTFVLANMLTEIASGLRIPLALLLASAGYLIFIKVLASAELLNLSKEQNEADASGTDNDPP